VQSTPLMLAVTATDSEFQCRAQSHSAWASPIPAGISDRTATFPWPFGARRPLSSVPNYRCGNPCDGPQHRIEVSQPPRIRREVAQWCQPV